MMRLFYVIATACAISLWAEQPIEAVTATDSPATIPEGVVPTPAQTDNPKLIGIGMVVVGLAMGFFLFGRRSKPNAGSDGASS